MSNVKLQKSSNPTPRWLIFVIIGLAVFNGLPFLAPLFMKLGWDTAGSLVYLAYSPLCHQMAQRSFFLFGPQGFQMYNANQLPVDYTSPLAPLLLKAFTGNAALGWKVAWSDRMVSMYGSPLIAAVSYAIARKFGVVRAMPWWGLALAALPMALDGGSHFVSDFAGVSAGFRDTNAWLAVLTNHIVPAAFYSGDALGSFNSWMRLLTGLIFGVGIGWFALPYMDEAGRSISSAPTVTVPAPSEDAPHADRSAVL